MDLIIAVLLILHSRVSALEHLYKELEHFGGSCFPRDSCTPSRSEADDHLWGNHTCECRAHCIQYGTCCANSPHVGKTLHVEYRGEMCQKLPSTFRESVIMVSRCSDRWRYGFQIRHQCEKPDGNTEDPLSMVPVTSLVTLVTYLNFFCALCNYDARDVSMWDIALQLETKESSPSLSNITDDYLLENLIYNKGLRAWGMTAKNNSFYKIKLQFKVPLPMRKFVKKCYPNMVTQCDPSYAYDYNLQYKCLSYYAPVKLQDNGKIRVPSLLKYRNIHCALCNNVSVSQTDGGICKLDVDSRKKKPAFSFPLLLDINRSDGDLVGKKQACGDKEMWDPFSKKCRSLVCIVPGHVIKAGKCVEN